MFLRIHGRQILLLHSYRNGLNQVRQRCLARFQSDQGRKQNWERLAGEVPQWGPELERLRPKAQELIEHLQKGEPSQQERLQQIERTARRLLRLLADPRLDQPQVESHLRALRARLREDALVGEGLRERMEQQRSRLVPCRKRFDTTETEAQDYLRCAQQLAHHLHHQGRREEALQTMALRVQNSPDLQANSEYAVWLQQGGQNQEAIRALQVLPLGDPWRNLNLAALHWQGGRFHEAFDQLSRGLVGCPYALEALQGIESGRKVWRGHQYWDKFGHLWDTPARQFLLALAAEPLAKKQLHRVLTGGARPRTLIREFPRRWMVPKLLAAVGLECPPRRYADEEWRARCDPRRNGTG